MKNAKVGDIVRLKNNVLKGEYHRQFQDSGGHSSIDESVMSKNKGKPLLVLKVNSDGRKGLLEVRRCDGVPMWGNFSEVHINRRALKLVERKEEPTKPAPTLPGGFSVGDRVVYAGEVPVYTGKGQVGTVLGVDEVHRQSIAVKWDNIPENHRLSPSSLKIAPWVCAEGCLLTVGEAVRYNSAAGRFGTQRHGALGKLVNFTTHKAEVNWDGKRQSHSLNYLEVQRCVP